MPHNDPLVVEVGIGACDVCKVLIDTGSFANVISLQTLIHMQTYLGSIHPSSRILIAFHMTTATTLGTIHLQTAVLGVSTQTEFSVIDISASYNAILGLSWIAEVGTIVSTYHQR